MTISDVFEARESMLRDFLRLMIALQVAFCLSAELRRFRTNVLTLEEVLPGL
jgi:hypothetical protein